MNVCVRCNNACKIFPINHVLLSPLAIFTKNVSNWLILICSVELNELKNEWNEN